MTEAILINKIKARIDELEPFADTDLNPDIEIVKAVINDNAESFIMSIPGVLVTPTNFNGDTIHTQYQDGSGRVELPDDFLKMHTFKMQEWERECVDFITPVDPKYKLQHNLVTRGGISKPVVVTKTDPAPGAIKYIYYYSCSDGTIPQAIETAWYIPVVSATSIQDNLAIPFVWYCAAEVLQILGQANLAEMARGKVQEFILSLTR